MKRKKKNKLMMRVVDDEFDDLFDERDSMYMDEDESRMVFDPQRWSTDLLERASRRARMRDRDIKRGTFISRRYAMELDEDLD